MAGYSVIAKPVGARCNLNCTYCYYLEKSDLYENGLSLMSEAVLEAYVGQMFDCAQPHPVEFAWQGGEPLLAGLDFFDRVFALQQRYAQGRPFSNTIQTNGVLLDDAWCQWLARHSVLVGLSLDGPPPLHDQYRVDRQGNGTARKVVEAARLMQQHGVDFNLLCTLNRANADRPLEVYDFLKEVGQGFIQFVPVVERKAISKAGTGGEVTEWSIEPEQLGDFYIAVYDKWLSQDVGSIFVQFFDAVLAGFLRAPSPVCFYSDYCGQSGVLEHNGDVYACDHYVYPQYKRGNILETPLSGMLGGAEQQHFGREKRQSLPIECRECAYLPSCNGECPKNRFTLSANGESRLNYLCSGYKRFFTHAAPSMEKMARIIRGGGIASDIMEAR